jgi:CRP-like cAMP-binding protein
LAKIIEEKSFKFNETIFENAFNSDFIYFIIEGSVKIIKKTEK